MKCKDCSYCKKIGNTEESNSALCSFSDSFIPITYNNDCILEASEYKCKDCDRFANDTACMICEAEDSAYYSGSLCSGFIDKQEEAVYNAFVDWYVRGFDVDDKLENIVNRFNLEFKEKFDKR